MPALLGRNLVGVYLYGSLTQRAFDPVRSDVDCIVVTRRDLSDAQFRRIAAWLRRAARANPLEREVGYLREEIGLKAESEWRDVASYRTYAVLTLCRIMHTAERGAVVSKPRAAAWALRRLPTEWHAIIRRALATGGPKRVPAIPLRRIEQFIKFADARLRAAGPRARR